MDASITFRADRDLAAVLHKEAAKQGVSLSKLVRHACRARFKLDGAEVDGRRFNRFPLSRSGGGRITSEGAR